MGIKMNGASLAQKIANDLKDRCDVLHNNNIYPILTIVVSDPNNMIYAKAKKKRCEEIGINVDLRVYDGLTVKICSELSKIKNPIIFDKPIIGVTEELISGFINPVLDVDGWSVENVGRLVMGRGPYHVPCTVKGVMSLLAEYNVKIGDKKVLVIGRSNNVGRPIASLFEQYGATVTVAHSYTDFGLLIDEIIQSDIIVSCVGKKDFMTYDEFDAWVDPLFFPVDNWLSSKIIIDVGGGDFNEDFKSKFKIWTPDKSCIGPMTVVSVCDNVLNYYEKYF